MDKIATIIVHYNTHTDTVNTLASLAKIKTPNFEHRVFVVDNGSKEVFIMPPNLPAKFTALVSIIRSETNLGFTGGNNLGFSCAKRDFDPDYFLPINSDTLAQVDFLSKLHQYLLDHPSAGLVSPLIYFAPHNEYHAHSYKKIDLGKVIWFAGGVIDWDNLAAFHQGVDEINRGQFASKDHHYDFATGCCFLIRREIYEVIGGFDNRYFLYYEDVDLSLRITQAGYKLGFCEDSHIWHVNGGSSGGAGSPLQHYYQTRNRLLFFWTHGSFKTKLTVIRLTFKYIFGEDKTLKLAAVHFISNHFGKQTYV